MPLKKNSQYYTKLEAWTSPIAALKEKVDITGMKVIDPCAGNGKMMSEHFPDGEAFDIDPQPNITKSGEPKPIIVKKCDMMTIDYYSLGAILLVISNIPFNADAFPIRKLNYIAKFKNVKYIAVMIASKYYQYYMDSHDESGTKFNEYFHPIHTEEVPSDGFVPAVQAQIIFQIYERRDYPRSEPKTMFKVILAKHIGNAKFTIGWKIENPLESFMVGDKQKKGSKGKNRKPTALVRGIRRSKEGKCTMYAFLNDHVKDMDLMIAEEKLHQVIRHSNSKFRHSSLGFGPGHLNQSQIELKMTV